MRRIQRSGPWVGALLALALVAAACGGSSGNKSSTSGTNGSNIKRGGSIVLAAEQWPSCLNPITQCANSSWMFWTTDNYVLPKLMEFDKNNNFINYRYSTQTGSPPPSPLKTPEGITIGSSPQDVRRAYPSADFSNPAYVTAQVGGAIVTFVTGASDTPGTPGPVVELKAGSLCGDY